MLAVNFEGSREIKKPPSMTDEECSGLPIFQAFCDLPAEAPAFVQAGVCSGPPYPFTLSAWMPSKEDREAILASRPIWVRFLSHTVIPMAVFTTDEKGDINQ